MSKLVAKLDKIKKNQRSFHLFQFFTLNNKAILFGTFVV